MRQFLWLVFLCFFSFCSWAVSSDPSQIGVGARPLGMGQAYTAVAGDASSIFLNPAGLADIENPKFMTMSGTLFEDVNYLSGAFAVPVPRGAFGIGYSRIGIGGIPLSTLSGTMPAVTGQRTDYDNQVLFLSYSVPLDNIFKRLHNVAFGTSLKLYSQNFSGGGVSMEGATGSGMDMDMGLQWKINKIATLGLFVQNFLPTSAGGKMTWQKNNVVESFPMQAKIGGAFHIIGDDGLHEIEEYKLDLFIDTQMYYSLKRPQIWNWGMEWKPLSALALRGGMSQSPRSDKGADNNFTAGVGINLGGFTFDYAYHKFGEVEENISHFFSFSYIGLPVPEKSKKKNLDFMPHLSQRPNWLSQI